VSAWGEDSGEVVPGEFQLGLLLVYLGDQGPCFNLLRSQSCGEEEMAMDVVMEQAHYSMPLWR
jgi:hypothetical protein